MIPLGPEPNARQRDAICAADRHVLVAAGAGTGKTFTVVRRVLHLLGVPIEGVPPFDGPVCTLDQIAAITFTVAAASELREALRAALRQAGREVEAFAVDSARVGTIHGFCADLLHTHALRRGRPLASRVLSEGEVQARAREAAEAALTSALTGNEPGLTDLAVVHGLDALLDWIARLALDGDRLRKMNGGDVPEALLLELARRSRTRLEQQLDAERVLDFDRILVEARDLLAGTPDVLTKERRRLHTLIIDEYQDVDPVQHEIAWLLADPVRGGAVTPRLFLVGDPSQSIYRFRRADVTLWRATERQFRQGAGEVIGLDQNRRSVPGILNFIATAVGAELAQPVNGPELSDFEVPLAGATAARPDGAGPAVEMLLIPPAADGGRRKVDDARAVEAEAIARRSVKFNTDGIPWGEMAVLLPAWSAVELYAAALERHRVPHYCLRGERFLERREVIDCLLALEVVRDQTDDCALIGWLRSPFVALRDDTILALGQYGTRPIAGVLDLPGLPEPELRAGAARQLSLHAALRDRVPVAELLQSLLQQSGYIAHLAARGERQAIANLRKFVALADRSRALSVGDFLRLIGQQRQAGVRMPDARLYDASEDVVTLTSVHSAKGLEWDVVFWADARRVSPSETDGLVTHRGELALRAVENRRSSSRGDQLARQEALEEQAERKRLWYVAATRARSHLVIGGVSLGHGKVTSGSAEDMLFRRITMLNGATPGAQQVGRGSASFALRLQVADEPSSAGAAATPAPLPVSRRAPEVQVPSGRRRQSATSLRLFERCPARYWFRYTAGLAEPIPTGASVRSMLTGSLVHEVLERLTLEVDVATLVGEVLRDAPELQGVDATLLEAYRDAVIREVALVEQHAGYRALRQQPSARTEVRFVELLGPDRALEGAIDLAALDSDGYLLLDVKTGQGWGNDAAERAASYRVQADVYSGAVETIGGQPAARFTFHFSRTAEQHAVVLSPASRLAARERVRALLDRIASGERGLTQDPAECEGCGYRRAGWCPGVSSGTALAR